MARLAAGKSKVYQQSSDEEEYESAFHTFDDREEEVMFGNVVHVCINCPDMAGSIKVSASDDNVEEEEEEDYEEGDEEEDDEDEEDDDQSTKPDLQELKRSM
jgi:hypothetical protein